MTDSWLTPYRHRISPVYLDYVGYESEAASISQSHTSVVPGLLQTAAYATVLTRSTIKYQHQADLIVQLRLQRQELLAARPVPFRQHYILDEAVLHRHVGSAVDLAIMPAQLRHLAGSALKADGLTRVQVIPFSTGEHAGLTGEFAILSFGRGIQDILYLDPDRGPASMISGSDPLITEYACNFEVMAKLALTPERSVDLILTIADKMERESVNVRM